jgi:hypothetical protein
VACSLCKEKVDHVWHFCHRVTAFNSQGSDQGAIGCLTGIEFAGSELEHEAFAPDMAQEVRRPLRKGG